MRRFLNNHGPWPWLLALCVLLAGCGTTKWSDSPRTATEQLLISDAVDRAISEIDFSALAGKHVFLDTRYIATTLDQNYVTSTLRQHMLASGIIIKDKPEDCTYVVEVRTGTLGTNRQDLLFGMPSTTLPTVGLLPVGSASIPEIALMKRTNQQGVCKISCFAYNRMTGRSVWQSGNRRVASGAKDIWVMGAGPFQRGTIYDGTAFAGEKLDVPLVNDEESTEENLSVSESKVFNGTDPASPDVQNASYAAPIPGGTAPPAAAATATANATSGAAAASGASSNSSGTPAAPGTTPAAGGSTPPATPPKAAYTPPVTAAAAAPPPVPGAGPQGNLPQTPVLTPTGNPAESAAGAIQTYGWAKDLVNRPKQ